MSLGGSQYKVYVTPLKALGSYGTEVEITDWVIENNVGSICRSIDSTDYDIGIYAFNDVTLVCDASDGYLGDQNDSRSIFQFSRDQAQVRIVFYKDGSPLTTFNGIINEKGCATDLGSETVTLTVMGYDSILKNTEVRAGSVSDGFTFKQAFFGILDNIDVTLLVVSLANIKPTYDGVVDIGKAFDKLTAKDALDKLLLPANSILTIDSSRNVHVKSRADSGGTILQLYGRGDLFDRENIVSVGNYNNGIQRTFNLVRVTGAQAPAASGVTPSALVGTASDSTSLGYYGTFKKELTCDFITQQASLDAIAAAILSEFRYPKPEITLTVPTEVLQAQTPPTDILDLVQIDYPINVRPRPNCRLPFLGITSLGDTTAPLPYTEGALVIDSSLAWKVIQIDENPQDFTSTLKLRVIGTGQNDGTFEFLETESGSILETESGQSIAT